MINKLRNYWAALRHSRIGSYDPKTYWENRHARYQDHRAVANELEPGKQRYLIQRQQFLHLLDSLDVRLASRTCLEFGCGDGFWAETVLSRGAENYVGIDISRTAVERCRAKSLANTRFICQDISTTEFESDEKFDIGFSIDVIQHIVDQRKLQCFLENLQSSVKPGGHVVLTSYTGYGDRYKDSDPSVTIAGVVRLPKLRWVHTWDWQTLERLLPECELIRIERFWDKAILLFRRGG